MKPDTTLLNDIEMSIRCANCLFNEWSNHDRAPYPEVLETLGDLRKVPHYYFLSRVRCCGKKTVSEIIGIQETEEFFIHTEWPYYNKIKGMTPADWDKFEKDIKTSFDK